MAPAWKLAWADCLCKYSVHGGGYRALVLTPKVFLPTHRHCLSVLTATQFSDLLTQKSASVTPSSAKESRRDRRHSGMPTKLLWNTQ